MFEFLMVQTDQNPEHHKYPGNETNPIHPSWLQCCTTVLVLKQHDYCLNKKRDS